MWCGKQVIWWNNRWLRTRCMRWLPNSINGVHTVEQNAWKWQRQISVVYIFNVRGFFKWKCNIPKSIELYFIWVNCKVGKLYLKLYFKTKNKKPFKQSQQWSTVIYSLPTPPFLQGRKEQIDIKHRHSFKEKKVQGTTDPAAKSKTLQYSLRFLTNGCLAAQNGTYAKTKQCSSGHWSTWPRPPVLDIGQHCPAPGTCSPGTWNARHPTCDIIRARGDLQPSCLLSLSLSQACS